MQSIFKLTLALLVALPVLADPPPGYYDSAGGLTGAALQQALHDIIDDHHIISYDAIWDAFCSTDARPDGIHVWDMYSDIPGGTPPYEYKLIIDQGGSASGEGEGYNREHSWPKSWFGGEEPPMYTDMFQVVPTDIYVNNRRAAYPYGEVNSPTWVSLNGSRLGPCSYPGYTGTVFEPIDEYKGDFARNYFYMATRYYGEDGGWPGSDMTDGAVLRPWAEEMLIEWHLADPVSDKETERNDAVYAIQFNRNPFIDHPEFVLYIYDPSSIHQEAPHDAPLVMCGNNPNPFTSWTSIEFTLSEAACTTIDIFDLAGRHLTTLVDNEQLAAGYHSIVWEGNTRGGASVPSGIYCCRVTGLGYTSTLAMLKIENEVFH